MRPILILPILLAATASTGFRPGQWQVTSAPGTATLNGRPLGDLPYSGAAGPQSICLSSADAAGVGWLARDLLPQGCSFTRRTLAAGRVDIAATCQPQAAGLARGQVRITGSYSPTSYAVRFATTNPSENGVMGFTGTLAGRRTGDCPISPPPRP